MTIKERSEIAIEKLKVQFEDLKKSQDTGSSEEVSDKVDRWQKRVAKTLETFVSKDEAQKFLEDEYHHRTVISDHWELTSGKIEYYSQKLNVIIAELKDHPESILDPSTIEVESTSSSDSILKQLHPEILKISKNEFNDEYYSNAVFSAFKSVNNRIKAHFKTTHGEELDGKNLMMRAFSETNPTITMGDLQSETGRNMQEGYRFIFAGSMQAIRNPKAHDHIEIDKKRAIHFLFLASLEMHKLDEAGVPPVGGSN